MGHTGLRPSTITKCGGKGAAFIRPGAPSYQFASGARRAARAAMAANDSMNKQQIEYGETEAKVLAIIDTVLHDARDLWGDAAWGGDLTK